MSILTAHIFSLLYFSLEHFIKITQSCEKVVCHAGLLVYLVVFFSFLSLSARVVCCARSPLSLKCDILISDRPSLLFIFSVPIFRGWAIPLGEFFFVKRLTEILFGPFLWCPTMCHCAKLSMCLYWLTRRTNFFICLWMCMHCRCFPIHNLFIFKHYFIRVRQSHETCLKFVLFRFIL